MAADGRTPPSRDIDVRLFIPLMAHSVAVHAIVSLARVTITYRAIELDLSVVWIGVIAAGFSLMPVFVAVQVGRYIDRGHDSVAAWIGAVLVLAACVGLWLWPLSAGYLLALSILLGVGHLFCMAAHQMLAVRCAGPRSREAVFGHFMIAIAIGQGLGPTALGLLGGSSALPPTGMLFAVCLAGAVASLVIAFALRPARAAKPRREEGQVVPVAALLRLQGLIVALWASVMTVTAFELLVIYLPLLGTERQIDTRDIGLLLAVRSLVSIFSRIFYVRLIDVVGRVRLMVACILTGAIAFLLLGVAMPLTVVYVAVAAMGFGLGIAATLTFSEVVRLAPSQARATALSLRITGNRLGQVLLPFLASVVATATGVGGVFVITAAMLAASGLAVRVSLRGR